MTFSIPHPDQRREWYPFVDANPERSPRDMGELKARVSVIEACIAILHQQLTYLPDAPSGAPTHQRGFVMADDLCEAIHAYATAHHRQVKDVLDLAWRRVWAQVGQEVGRA